MAVTFYKDLSLDFTPHPVSGDIRPITDDIAVKRALLNLINTKKGSVPFRPDYGSSVVDYLFKNADVFTQKELERSLYDTITKHEPRVTVLVIDAQFENYGVKIQVDFRIRNRSGIQTLTTTVRRTA
jgi:phage baseplate assembly protein W